VYGRVFQRESSKGALRDFNVEVALHNKRVEDSRSRGISYRQVSVDCPASLGSLSYVGVLAKKHHCRIRREAASALKARTDREYAEGSAEDRRAELKHSPTRCTNHDSAGITESCRFIVLIEGCNTPRRLGSAEFCRCVALFEQTSPCLFPLPYCTDQL
jgi:hypothetical protein